MVIPIALALPVFNGKGLSIVATIERALARVYLSTAIGGECLSTTRLNSECSN